MREREAGARALAGTALEAAEAQAARERKATGSVSAGTAARVRALQAELAPRPPPSARPPPAEAIPRLVAGLAVQAGGLDCAAYLLRLAQGLLGGEARLRRLRCSGAEFQERVMDCSGGRELLLQAGYALAREGGEEVLVYAGGEDLALVRALASAIVQARGTYARGRE